MSWWSAVYFDHIKAQPEIRQENMDKAIAINNAAAGDPALSNLFGKVKASSSVLKIDTRSNL